MCSRSAISSVLGAHNSILGTAYEDSQSTRRGLLDVQNLAAPALSDFAEAINLTATTKALCSSLLVSSQFAGAMSGIASSGFGLECARESFELTNGLELTTPSFSESLTFPSNFSAAMHLTKLAGEYIDARFVSFDQALFGDTYNTSINGGVIGFSAYEALFGDAIPIEGLSEPVTLTLAVHKPYNLTFERFRRTCYGDDILSVDCPLGTKSFECNASDTQFGTYFVEATCPGYVPTCLWWEWETLRWRGDSCVVSNYTSLNVTCECTAVADVFGVGTNVSALVLTEITTFAPSKAPTPLPSSPPTSSPTPSPTPLPIASPTLPPSPSPSSAPSPAPSTPTAVPTFLTLPMPTPSPVTTPYPTPAPSEQRYLICRATAGAVLLLHAGNDADDFGSEESEAFSYAVASSVAYATSADDITVKNVHNYASRRRRGLLDNSTLASPVLVNFTLEIVLEDSGFEDPSSRFHDALLVELVRAFTADKTSKDSFLFHLGWYAERKAITSLYNASLETNATIAVLYRLYDTNLYEGAREEEPEKASFWQAPLQFEFTVEEARLAAEVTSVIVAGAIGTSVAASVGSSIAGSLTSSGGSGGSQAGDGDLMSVVFTVQFTSLIAQLNFPAEETFRTFGAGFAWMNGQFRWPLPFRCVFIFAYRLATQFYCPALSQTAASFLLSAQVWWMCTPSGAS